MTTEPTLMSSSLPDDNECQSLMCRREGWDLANDDIGKCIGYHCAKCGKPSSMYGHYSGNPGSFSCVTNNEGLVVTKRKLCTSCGWPINSRTCWELCEWEPTDE